MQWRSVVAGLTLVTGCYTWQSASYQRPSPAAEACFAACKARGDDAAVFACARDCPDAAIAPHPCAKDRPEVACVAQGHLDAARTVRAVFVITLVTLLGALVVGGLALAGGST